VLFPALAADVFRQPALLGLLRNSRPVRALH